MSTPRVTSSRTGGLRLGPLSDPNRYLVYNHENLGAQGVVCRGRDLRNPERGTIAIKIHKASSIKQALAVAERLKPLEAVRHPHLAAPEQAFVGPVMHYVREWPLHRRIWYRFLGAVAGSRRRNVLDQRLYEVSRWVPGKTLRDRFEGQPLEPAQAFRILGQVGSALDVLHSGPTPGLSPVVHGDVSPTNIIINEDSTAVLIDFGLAQPYRSDAKTSTDVSPALGTPGYLAPERLGGAPASPAADRYALGAVAYFLLTATDPPPRPDAESLRAALTAAGLTREHTGRVLQMLDPEPMRRPRSSAEWAQGRRGETADAHSQAYQEPAGKPAPILEVEELASWVQRWGQQVLHFARRPVTLRSAIIALMVCMIMTTVIVVVTFAAVG